MELKTTLIVEERDVNNVLINTYGIGDVVTLTSNKGTKTGRINSIKYNAIELDLSKKFSGKYSIFDTSNIFNIVKQ